jgi:hypothetical protein
VLISDLSRLARKERVTLCLLLAHAILCPAVQHATNEGAKQTDDAAVLIQRCAENEVAALQTPSHLQYFEQLDWSWGTETRRVIETVEGRADRIVAFNGESLAPEQAERENRRLEKLLRDPNAIRHELREQAAETKRRVRLMEAFVSAFVFEPQGDEAGFLKFSFRPNRSFAPTNRETQMFRGMEGTVWVEPQQERLVRIDGALTHDVAFGWGIFGRLYKGGHYFVEQTQMKPGLWRITRLDLDLKIRTFFNTSRLLRREHNSQFRAIAETTTYRKALEELLDNAGPDR